MKQKNTSKTRRTIIVPNEVHDRLKKLSHMKEEIAGVLLYRQNGNICSVEAGYVIGIGNDESVAIHEPRGKVVNGFLDRHPEYKFIFFHTHSAAGVEKVGIAHANKFSQADINAYKSDSSKNPEAIHMMVNPIKVQIISNDVARATVVEYSEAYDKNHSKIQAELKQIGERMGVPQERFKGTKFTPKMR